MVRGSVYFLPVHIIKHWACWSTTRDTWHCCLQHTHPPVSPPPLSSPCLFLLPQQHRGALVWSSLDSAPIFFFTPTPWQHCSRDEQPWLLPLPLSKQRQEVMEGGRVAGKGNCEGDEGYVGMREGIIGRCLGWRLWGETSSAVCARVP